jgi:2-(1,2-epoxy-1,2-dihydrophenyl)acetyl-CoA isomerase
MNGMAAGAAIAIDCEIVLAAESARFQCIFAKFALGPDRWTSWLLARLVGQARALGLALMAEPIEAREAERIGLIWKAAPVASLMFGAKRIAEGFACGPTAALATIKQRIRSAASLSFDDALDAERDAQGALGRDEAYKTAVMDFVNKRSR